MHVLFRIRIKTCLTIYCFYYCTTLMWLSFISLCRINGKYIVVLSTGVITKNYILYIREYFVFIKKVFHLVMYVNIIVFLTFDVSTLFANIHFSNMRESFSKLTERRSFCSGARSWQKL